MFDRLLASLKFRIVALAVSTGFAAALGTAIVVLDVTQGELQHQLLANASDDRERTAALLSSKLEMLKASLAAVARKTPAAGWHDADVMAAYLLDKPAIGALFDSVLAATPDGTMLVRIEKGERTPELPNIADRAYFKVALRSDQPVVSEPMIGKVSKQPLVVVAVPVLDAQGGHTSGIVAGTLRLKSNSLFVDPLAVRDGPARDLVLNRQGTVLAHSNPARVLGRASDEPGFAAVFARWQDMGSPIDTRASSELSQDHLVSMAGIPWSDWVLVRLVPRAAALEPMDAARRAAWLAALAAGLLSALLAGAVAWTAVRPIGQLRDRAERMLAGDDVSADDWPRQSGEIGAMSQAFQLLLQMQDRQRGEMQAHRDQLSWAASHDRLTGLVNRAAFEALLEAATAHAIDAPFCMLFIDLDRFKEVNDTSGHAAGDALLCGVAQALAARLRKSDTVARLGGDEFAVLLPQCPPTQAQALAEKLRSAVEDFRLEWEGTRHGVGASIGMVAADGTHASAAEVLRAADAACYRAKRAGRNQVALAEA